MKRILDGRRDIPLAYQGESRFSTTSVGNLSALTLHVLEHPGTRILNAVDPETPTVYDRGTAIADYMGANCNLVRLGSQPAESRVGMTPWSVRAPFIADDSKARKLGYSPVETYAQGVAPMINWLIETQAHGDWRKHFPDMAKYNPFDYDEEDKLLAQ